MRGIAADPLREDDAHRFGEHQALGQVEVARHAFGVHFQTLGDQQRLLQAAGHQAANLRQGFPFCMPQPETAFVFLWHGAEQRREQTGYTSRRADQHRRAYRVAFVRHGRGTTLARRRRFEHFARLGLHQQADVAAEFAEAAGDKAKHRAKFHHAIALGVPWLFRQVQLQLFGQRLGNRHGLITERGERPGSAAELQHQQAWFEFDQTLAITSHRAQPTGDFHAEGDRCRVLQPGAPGQRRSRITLSLGRENLPQLRQIAFDQFQCAAQLQHQAAVHHVLTGRAQMHVALGFGVLRGDLFAQRLDQRNRRIARRGNRLAEGCKVVMPGLTRGHDRRHRRLRNQTDPRFGPGQCRFKIEHGLDAALIAEHVTHIAGSEIGIEQLIARSLVHKQSLEARAGEARVKIKDRGADTSPVAADAG
ncbi:hypothetical protein D3C81_811720 [compost metagenome]